jgi:hypothetical protein
MKESPAYREIMDEGSVLTRREDILDNLKERFGKEAAEQVRADLLTIDDLTRLACLHGLSIRCPDLVAFREGLQAEMPPRRRPSRRRR